MSACNTEKDNYNTYILRTQYNVYLTECLTITDANTRIFIKCEKLVKKLLWIQNL